MWIYWYYWGQWSHSSDHIALKYTVLSCGIFMAYHFHHHHHICTCYAGTVHIRPSKNGGKFSQQYHGVDSLINFEWLHAIFKCTASDLHCTSEVLKTILLVNSRSLYSSRPCTHSRHGYLNYSRMQMLCLDTHCRYLLEFSRSVYTYKFS